MNESYEEELNRIKNKKKNIFQTNLDKVDLKKSKKYLVHLITRVLISAIFVLGSVIYTNTSTNNLNAYKEIVLTDNLSFTKINKMYKKYFGNILPNKVIDDETKLVFSASYLNSEYSDYVNGVSFTVENETPIDILESGIVVFIGDKEDYGKTVIIQGINGVDYWYGNVTNIGVSLYDYVKKGDIVAVSNDLLYLAFNKDGNYLKYEEFITKN